MSLAIEFIDNVQKRSEAIALLIVTVNTVVDSYKTNIVVWKFDLRIHSYLKMISADTGLLNSNISYIC